MGTSPGIEGRVDSLEPAHGLHHRPLDRDTNVTPRLAPLRAVSLTGTGQENVTSLPSLSKGLFLIMPLVIEFIQSGGPDPPEMTWHSPKRAEFPQGNYPVLSHPGGSWGASVSSFRGNAQAGEGRPMGQPRLWPHVFVLIPLSHPHRRPRGASWAGADPRQPT